MPPAESFSIIVPTFREANNIPTLLERIANLSFDPQTFEVIIVDDNSQDGIEALVHQLQQRYPWLQFISRTAAKSLSASAMAGFQKAKFPLILLMDADLSHPPEKIPALINALKEPGVDFVLGSRYVAGGSTDEVWPRFRRMTSQLSAWIAQKLLSAPIKDPLSGFFALRKSRLSAGDPLNPIGWKIGLEIMLKCRCRDIREIPIHFSQRLHGDSKLNLKVAVDYFYHLNRLVFYKMFS